MIGKTLGVPSKNLQAELIILKFMMSSVNIFSKENHPQELFSRFSIIFSFIQMKPAPGPPHTHFIQEPITKSQFKFCRSIGMTPTDCATSIKQNILRSLHVFVIC